MIWNFRTGWIEDINEGEEGGVNILLNRWLKPTAKDKVLIKCIEPYQGCL
jgi:hypothetical protein